jgi:hypothetical protein
MCCIIDTWVRTHLLCLAWSDLLGIRSEKDVQVIRVFWPPSLPVVWPSTQQLDRPSLPSLSLLRLCKNTPIYTYQYLNIKISNFCWHTSQHNAEISHWFDVDYCRVEDKRTNDSLPTGSHWSNNNCALTRISTLLHQYKHFFLSTINWTLRMCATSLQSCELAWCAFIISAPAARDKAGVYAVRVSCVHRLFCSFAVTHGDSDQESVRQPSCTKWLGNFPSWRSTGDDV